MTQSFISIIILNYNGKKDTLACLESLFGITYKNYEVILIDNGSKDGSISEVYKKFNQKIKVKKLKIIQNKQNLGFAEGNNVGIRWVLKKKSQKSDYLMLLNNDTLVNPNFLDILIKNVLRHSEFNVFGPQMRMYPAKNRIWYAGGMFLKPLGSIKMFNRGDLISQSQLKKPTPVSFINGAGMLVKIQTFEKVGFLDGNFFLYWEEADWQARALKLEYKFLYVPNSIIWHKVGASAGGENNPVFKYYFYRNNLLFVRKNLAFYFWPTFLLYFIFRILIIEIVYRFIQYLMGDRKSLKNARFVFLGIFDFFRGKFGQRKL